MNYYEKRELAWKCWIDISKKLEEIQYYTLSNGFSGIRKGCGGDVVDVIMKYL